MCGIVAAFGTIHKKHEEAFKLMLMFDTIRGPHSTGVGSVLRSNPENVDYLKSTGTPWDLFADDGFTRLMNRFHAMLLGHNRYATKGAVTSKNAHPFIHGNLMGVHNGTIWNQKDLDDHKEFEVDSENIYYHMSRHGVKETVKAINGAFALVWYDKETRSINAIRNDQRPLHYVFTKDEQTIFFASEPWMLHVALTKADIEFGTIHTVPSGQLHSVILPEKYPNKLELKTETLELYSHKKPHYSYHNGYYSLKGNSNSATSKSTVTNIADQKYKKLIGQTVLFSICGVHREGNAKFILAELENDPQINIKFFESGDKKFWDMLLNSPRLFKGVVKSWSGHGNKYYLTVRRNSVEEVSEEEFQAIEEERDRDIEKVKDLIVFSCKGWNGVELNLKEWEFAVEQGCSLCGEVPQLIHADFLTWSGPRSFFCPKCDEEFFQNELGLV